MDHSSHNDGKYVKGEFRLFFMHDCRPTCVLNEAIKSLNRSTSTTSLCKRLTATQHFARVAGRSDLGSESEHKKARRPRSVDK
jgi:hypothetical protein